MLIKANASQCAVSIPSVLAVGAVGMLLLAGCAHESTISTVRADGAWTRKTLYSISDSPGGADNSSPKLEDLFTMPSGAGWKVERRVEGKENKQTTVVATRELAAGEAVSGDLTVKSRVARGSVPFRIVNAASVRPAGPGRWLYTETFHWLGRKPRIQKDMAPLLGRSIRPSLPPLLATDANMKLLTPRVERALWKALFAPPEPLMLDFFDNVLPIPALSDPEERRRLIVRRCGPGIEGALQETFGARLSPERRRQTAVQIATRMNDETTANAAGSSKTGGPAGKSPGMDSGTDAFGEIYPVAITVSVKMPGRVLETNGIRDEIANDVYWTVYPQAALEQDVTLRAMFDTARPERARATGSAPLSARLLAPGRRPR